MSCYPVLLVDPFLTSGYIVRIESDTEYTGFIGNRVISDFGDKSYPVNRGECWNIQKRTYGGLLRVFGTVREYYATTAVTFPRWDDNASVLPYVTIRGCLR